MTQHRDGRAIASALGVAIVVSVWRCRWPARQRQRRRRRTTTPRARCVVRRCGAAPAADHERQVPGGTRHRDRSTRGPLGTPLRGNGPMGVPRPFGVRTGTGQEVEDQSVDGLRADAVPSSPGVGLLPDSERSGSRARPFPPRHPSHRRRAVEDPVVARRRQLLLASATRTCSPQAQTSVRSGPTSRAGSGPSTPESARRGSSRESGHRARRTLVFNPNPELTVAPPGSPGAVTQKVTGFADCGGALYTTINTTLYRRNDGALPSGIPRWVPVYRAPPVGPHNSGLRGITCLTHDGSPSLLISTEGNGNVYRFDDLPRGQLDTTAPRIRARSPTGWCRRSSSNRSPPSARCWRRRERSFRPRDEARSST